MYATYADVMRPAAKLTARLYDMALILACSLFIALTAQIAIWLPFSPVPVTGQTLAVLLVGVLLGSKRGALSLVVYLAEGAAGMPVFAGGASGPVYMTGPTGGYLFGFVAAAYMTGWLAERGWDRRAITTALVMLIGNGIIYICGVAYLSTFLGAEKAVLVGLKPFIAGDIAKIGLAMVLLPAGWKILKR